MNTGIYKKISFWILVVLLSMGTQNVFALPTPTPSTVTYCKGATTSALTATPSVGSYTLRWYTDSIGGTFTASITPVSSVVGTLSYWVSEYNGTTESSRVKVNVIVNDLPANPSVASPIDVCQGETADALLAFGTGLKYYDGTLAYLGTTAPVPVTTTAGLQTFYVTQTDATTTCGSDK
jgi:hypothetical protein